MKVEIQLPATLRPYADHREAVAVDAKAVDEALGVLIGRHASLRKHLFGENGMLRTGVNIYLNDEEIRHLDGPKTTLRDGDTLQVIPFLAGG